MTAKKLILLDVFSYSCMNCLRSLKYVKKIDRKYRKHGLRTIIIHPPEWEFEKSKKNIANAANANKIEFPIIIDSKKKLINKLNVDFWPAQILFSNGKRIYNHIGEGSYMKLEDKIMQFFNIKTKKIFHSEPKYSKYPAIYLGGKKNNFNGIVDIKTCPVLKHRASFEQTSEYIKFLSSGSLTLLAKGSIVNMVAQSTGKNPIKTGINLNNKFIKNIAINNPDIYNLIKLNDHSKKTNNVLTIMAKPNLAVYSFSFE